MNIDYSYGNQYYQYYGNTGIKSVEYEILAPEQSQNKQPGMEYLMNPRPIFDNPDYIGSGKLKDKVAIITGGDSGLGRAAAVAYAKEGAKLVIPYYDEHQDAMETKRYIELLGGECEILSGDISDKNFCKKIVNYTLDRFGKIDILVNNAGISCQKLFTDMSPNEFDDIFRVNLYSMFYCTQVAVKDMLKRHYGKIVNISSIWGITGASCEVAYSSSKAGVIGFTKSLAQELGPSNINVNCVAPGVIQTDMNKFLSKNELEELINNTPLCRVGYPYEIAKTVKFLVSSDSDFITGQVISPNGGYLI